MDIHFILCVIISIILSFSSDCSIIGSSLSCFCVPLTYPWLWVSIFSTLYFLMEQDAPGPSYIFLQQFQNHSLFQAHFWFIFIGVIFRNQDLSLRNEVCSLLWGAIASSLLSWQTKEIYTCVIQIFIKIFFRTV